MPALLLYLLQVNFGLAVLYLTYRLLLRPTTFYQLNRWFLLTGLLLALFLPLLDISTLFKRNQPVYETISGFSGAWQMDIGANAAQNGLDFWQLPVYLFWLGAGVMGIRLLVQMASLYQLHQQSQKASYQGFTYRQLHADFPPFSFGNTIYFNPKLHPPAHWLPILQHEHTHVRQCHTADILLMEGICLFHWFNPVVWLLRVALKQNLEFLTDQQTLEAGIDRKQYQFSLLQTAGAPPVAFTFSFSFHSLKHRILMMNKAPSHQLAYLRVLVALPLLALSLCSLQVLAESGSTARWQLPTQDKPTQKSTSKSFDYDMFQQRNQTVDRLGWNQKTLFVHLKNGKTETYARTAQGLAAAEKKYGTLPPPPPPPPAPPATSLAPPPPPPPAPPINIESPKEFRQRNPTVKGLSIDPETIFVVLKSGDVESFDNTPAGRAAFEKKYGALPPPPPPVKAKKKPITKFAPPVNE